MTVASWYSDYMSDDIEIQICSDCAMMSANGLAGWEYEQDWLETYLWNCKAYGAEPVLTCGEDCDGGFSWSPCGFCGSKLGGDRHPAILMERGK